MAEFKLPDVGEGLTEAEIVTWKVKEGDTVTINQILVEIETAKSLVELPSPYAGVVQSPDGARGRDRARSGRRSSRSGTRSTGPCPRTPDETRRADGADRVRPLPRDGREGRGGGAGARGPLHRHRPVQPGRERLGRGRVAGGPDEGRPRRHPARAQAGRGDPDPGGVRAHRLDGADRPRRGGRERRSGRPRDRPRLARPPATCACWRSRRCASWPGTSASTSPRSPAPGPTAPSPARTSRPLRTMRDGRWDGQSAVLDRPRRASESGASRSRACGR